MSATPMQLLYRTVAPMTIPSFTLEASGTADFTSLTNPQTFTLPSSYSTALNDCIVVAYCVSGSTAPTVGGTGATWLTEPCSFTTAPRTGIYVGYACSAGQTSFQLSGVSGIAGSLCIGVFSGVKSVSTPLAASDLTHGTSSGTSVTTGSLSYTGPQLLVASGGASATPQFGSGAPAVWSNGATNNTIGFDNTGRPSRLDYIIEGTGASGSTTVQETASPAGTLMVAFLVLNHS